MMELAGTGAALAPQPAPGGGRAARRAEPEIAAHLAGGVLGAGMVIMPPVVAALAGGRGLLVWSAHILLGGSVSLMLAGLVRTRVPPTSLAGAVGALLGRWAERVADAVFAVALSGVGMGALR